MKRQTQLRRIMDAYKRTGYKIMLHFTCSVMDKKCCPLAVLVMSKQGMLSVCWQDVEREYGEIYANNFSCGVDSDNHLPWKADENNTYPGYHDGRRIRRALKLLYII